ARLVGLHLGSVDLGLDRRSHGLTTNSPLSQYGPASRGGAGPSFAHRAVHDRRRTEKSAAIQADTQAYPTPKAIQPATPSAGAPSPGAHPAARKVKVTTLTAMKTAVIQ